ncbi:MAG: 3-deoxy-D-manno-octulosonic acid kinase [Xanthomonadales bacterium]|nr:3-deoxy-D-manno-octulosonic acid kinase [Xanthomonadales bacterium]
MKPRSHKQDSVLIVYDADLVQHPGAHLFDAAYWEQKGALAGAAVGRGSAYFLGTPFGEAVLREYLRGGVPGRFNRDRYLFTGWQRSRPVAEFGILAELSAAGLPVPQPLAAITQRHGPFYTGSLLTHRIMDSLPVADLVAGRSDAPGFWKAIGACVRRFHEHGVIHADLNARNILVDAQERVYLIDFDRARIEPGQTAACSRNMKRLRRSFEKVWPVPLRDRLDPCWDQLWRAYENPERAA